MNTSLFAMTLHKDGLHSTLGIGWAYVGLVIMMIIVPIFIIAWGIWGYRRGWKKEEIE